MGFVEDMQKRHAAQRAQTAAEIRALGYRVISCVSFHDPRDGKHLITSWSGDTRQVLLKNAPPNPARFGIGNILVASDSEVVDPSKLTQAEIDALKGSAVSLTVFTSTQIRDP
jgi:hypothetical protein